MRSIKASVLIIVAGQDVVPAVHAVKMSQLIPGARLLILPGSHGSCIGAADSGALKGSKLPAITAALVEEFLND